MGILVAILVGCLAGYAGSKLFSGSSNGLLMNLLIGIVGGMIGDFAFGLLGIGGNDTLWSFVSATIGAVILLWVISLIKKK